MSRFVPQRDMSSDEIISCAYEASAITRLCEAAAWSIQNGEPPTDLADAIGAGMRLARDLIDVMHDALVSHEGLASKEVSQ
ncbi:hypothetical protein [Mesorhizobium sp. KR1-2]|uniref:hypothetical protein n=1 Tax=Mesorhizobium sp. KR1-2 TaxID=3156609 RepID=UPI0032B4D5B7